MTKQDLLDLINDAIDGDIGNNTALGQKLRNDLDVSDMIYCDSKL